MGRKKQCATLISVTKQEQLCPALSMVEDIFWHAEPCREWAGHKHGKKWLLFISNWEQILFHSAVFVLRQKASWNGNSRLRKFIISTQRQADRDLHNFI